MIQNVKYYKLVFKMLVNIFMFLILYNKDFFLTTCMQIWSFIAMNFWLWKWMLAVGNRSILSIPKLLPPFPTRWLAYKMSHGSF